MIRFGVFEVDPSAGELRKSGVKIRIQEQPFQLLQVLLERPGEVVTRDQLRERLWPEDTFVDFDRSLNTAASRLREALGDSASNPRFVETLPRRGYRFVAPVAGEVPAESTPPEEDRRWIRLGAVVGVIAGVLAGGWLFLRNGESDPSANLTATPFTTTPGRELAPAFSPDGEDIAFVWNGPAEDNFDIYVQRVGSTQPMRLTTDPAVDFSPVWSPDGREIAFCRQIEGGGEIRVVPALGGAAQLLAKLPERWFWTAPHTAVMSWSPNGRWLAVQREGYLSLLSIETREWRRLTSPPAGSFGDAIPTFSPDGRFLAFSRDGAYRVADICLLSIGQGGGAEGAPDCLGLKLDFGFTDFGLDWMPDGQRMAFSDQRGLWSIAVSGGEPSRLSVAANGRYPSVSRESGRLAFVVEQTDHNIWRVPGPMATADSPPVRHIASTHDDDQPQYSPNGERIVFWSRRSGASEIWRCDSNGDNHVQLTDFGSSECGDPRWSPDGEVIAFDCVVEGNKDIWVVPSEGGAPRRITTDPAYDVRPSWSQDGKWIYFGSTRGEGWQIWKTPSEGGGKPVQLTYNGGREAFESWDGETVYFVKTHGIRGIWKVPVAGGEETLVLDKGMQGYWALLESGICLMDFVSGPRPVLEFFDLENRQLRKVRELPEEAGSGRSLRFPGSGYIAGRCRGVRTRACSVHIRVNASSSPQVFTRV